MYLPKSQYMLKKVSDLDAASEIKDRLGNIYNSGEVVITSYGSIFSKKGIDFIKGNFTNAIELFVSKDKPDEDEDSGTEEQPHLASNNARVQSVKLPPNRKDRASGIMNRIFYKNTSTGKVQEITANSAKRLARRLQPYEILYSMNWNIRGPLKDQYINGYFLEGIETKNKKLLEDLAKKLPGAEKLVENTSEYVEDTLPITDQTKELPQNDFDIPSPS